MWRKIYQGVAAFFGVTVISNISGIIQTVLTFRYLSPAEYGQYTLLLSFFTIGRTFFDMGAVSIFMSEIAQADGAQREARLVGLMRVYGRFVGVTAVLVTLTFFAIAFSRSQTTFFILGLYALLFGLNFGSNTVLLGFTQFKPAASQQVVRSISRLTLLATLPLLATPSLLLPVLWTHVIKEGVVLLFSIYWLRPYLQRFSDTTAKRVSFWTLFSKQGIYLIASYPIRQVIGEAPIWLLSVLVGETAVGLFGAARKAYNLLNGFFMQIETILFPVLPSEMNNMERVRVAIRQSQKYTFWLALLIVVPLLPLAPFLVMLLGGEQYEDVVAPLRWLLLLLPLGAFIQSHRPTLFAVNKQKPLFLIRLLKMVTYLPLTTLFVLSNGATGAAQAAVIDATLHLFVRWRILYLAAPQFWVSPLSIFVVEPFDSQLFAKVKEQIQRRFSSVSHNR